MPVVVDAEMRRLSSDEFARVAYDVMEHAFAVHNEFGRCFDEGVYQRAIAERCLGRIEVPVDVIHGDFGKRYFLDLLVAGGAIFELKTTASLNDRHRNQLLFYLLLTDMPRGKLVNMRPASVQHEFVNARPTLGDRTTFMIDEGAWDARAPGAAELRDRTVALLRDVGTGLSVALYQEALVQLLGGEDQVLRKIPVISEGREVGRQELPLAAPEAAFRVTTFDDKSRTQFAPHLSRFLSHSAVDFLHWINIYRKTVTLTTLRR